MARAGHEESLSQWMPLSSWLAMALFDLIFPLLPLIMEVPPVSQSKIYILLIGEEAAAKMKEATIKIKAAADYDSLTGVNSVGVDENIAELMEFLSGIWLMKPESTGSGFKEEPLPSWLRSYLSNPDENGLYDAWSWADKIWSVYSFFCIDKKTVDVEEAFLNLVRLAGVSGDDMVQADLFLDKILESESKRLGYTIDRKEPRYSKPLHVLLERREGSPESQSRSARASMSMASPSWVGTSGSLRKIAPEPLSPTLSPNLLDEFEHDSDDLQYIRPSSKRLSGSRLQVVVQDVPGRLQTITSARLDDEDLPLIKNPCLACMARSADYYSSCGHPAYCVACFPDIPMAGKTKCSHCQAKCTMNRIYIN
jgi:hypothetical protein